MTSGVQDQSSECDLKQGSVMRAHTAFSFASPGKPSVDKGTPTPYQSNFLEVSSSNTGAAAALSLLSLAPCFTRV